MEYSMTTTPLRRGEFALEMDSLETCLKESKEPELHHSRPLAEIYMVFVQYCVLFPLFAYIKPDKSDTSGNKVAFIAAVLLPI